MVYRLHERDENSSRKGKLVNGCYKGCGNFGRFDHFYIDYNNKEELNGKKDD